MYVFCQPANYSVQEYSRAVCDCSFWCKKCCCVCKWFRKLICRLGRTTCHTRILELCHVAGYLHIPAGWVPPTCSLHPARGRSATMMGVSMWSEPIVKRFRDNFFVSYMLSHQAIDPGGGVVPGACAVPPHRQDAPWPSMGVEHEQLMLQQNTLYIIVPLIVVCAYQGLAAGVEACYLHVAAWPWVRCFARTFIGCGKVASDTRANTFYKGNSLMQSCIHYSSVLPDSQQPVRSHGSKQPVVKHLVCVVILTSTMQISFTVICACKYKQLACMCASPPAVQCAAVQSYFGRS